MERELKSFWGRFFNFDWKFGLFLVLLVCIPRFVLVLQANASGSYGSIGIIMLLSALAPFVFLTRFGRKAIGLARPKNYRWLIAALVCGLAASVVLHFIGQALYDTSYQNWYRYIGKSYKIPAAISQADKNMLFVIMAVTGMTFSPIGEELFFRGIVHSSFAKSMGERKASLADGAAFALTHVSHFGLVFINNGWDFFAIPTIIWVTGMFLVSLLFFSFVKKTGSIWGAVLCHAGFNLGMIYCIFYLL